METINDYLKNMDFGAVKELMGFESIDRDLILLEDISKIPFFDVPVEMNSYISLICTSGSIEIGVDLERYTITAPSIAITLHGQVSQFFSVSPDFKGLFLVGSDHLSDKLEVDPQRMLPLFFYIKEHPVAKLTEQELTTMSEFYFMLKKIVNLNSCIYHSEVVRHLLHSILFLTMDIFAKRQQLNEKPRSSQELLFEAFIRYVKIYCKEQRELKFYADKLCLTPKYLSSIIKKTSNRSANEWIDRHVILTAQARLKSTRQSIQQISEELHFPNQSFFGKYFKRHTGFSPKEYRER